MHQKKLSDFDQIHKYICDAPLVKGDNWYMLDKTWYDSCKAYHDCDSDNTVNVSPGPIDNSALFQPIIKSTKTNGVQQSDSTSDANLDGKFKSPSADAISVDSRPLRNDIAEAEGHFLLIPEKCWFQLKEAFGIVSESHTIKRRVIEITPGCNIVEIKPISLKMCLYGGKEATVERSFSRITTLEELQQEMRKVFNISSDRETKLWIDNQSYTFKASAQSATTNTTSSSSLSSTHITPLKPLANNSPIKPPPTPPPMPGSSSSMNNSTSPTVVTRKAASSLNKPIALADSTTSTTNMHNTRSSSVSTSDSPLSVSSTSASASSPSSSINTTASSSSSGIAGGTSSSSAATSTKESSPTQTFVDVGVFDSAVVTLEVINADGTWPSSRPRFGTVTTRSSKAQPGLCGLSNMGNTCFMNAALQCLSNTPPLTDYILTDQFVKDINTNNPLGMHGEIARTYAELIKVMWSGNNTSFLPREFKCAVSRFAPQFMGFTQQDCQELMAFLLDGLHEDLNRIRNKPYIEIKSNLEPRRPDEVVAEESWSNYKKRNDSIVVDTFHAMLKSTLVCPGCSLVSVTFDPFCYLSLPLPVKRESSGSSFSASTLSSNQFGQLRKPDSESSITEPVPKPALQLKDCITQFTSVERLGAEDPWYCPKCKKHQQATKKFDIWSLPKVLIIHLKRFSFSRSWRDKIDTLVEFPVENLDMSEFVLNPEQKKTKQIYNLIGVANHFGGLGGGHYTAYAKNHLQDSWYSFDDALVAQAGNVVTKGAYVLFYKLQENGNEENGSMETEEKDGGGDQS